MSDLVQIQPGSSALATTAGSSWGEAAENAAVEPRYIQLKQSNSSAVAMENFRSGHFVDSKVGRSWETIQIVILEYKKGRRFQSPYEPGKKRDLYCRSNNRVVPVTNDDRFEPKSTTCGECPYGTLAWARYNKTKRKEDIPKNPCEFESTMLFIMKENPLQPYLMTLQGRNQKAGDHLFDTLVVRATDVKQNTKRMPELYEFAITLTSERHADGKYSIKVAHASDMTPEEAQKEFGPAHQQFVVARNAAYAARMNAAAVQDQLAAENEVVEEAVKPAEKPVIDASFLPPPSKRVAGTKPVYQPPTIDAKADISPVDDSGEQTPAI